MTSDFSKSGLKSSRIQEKELTIRNRMGKTCNYSTKQKVSCMNTARAQKFPLSHLLLCEGSF